MRAKWIIDFCLNFIIQFFNWFRSDSLSCLTELLLFLSPNFCLIQLKEKKSVKGGDKGWDTENCLRMQCCCILPLFSSCSVAQCLRTLLWISRDWFKSYLELVNFKQEPLLGGFLTRLYALGTWTQSLLMGLQLYFVLWAAEIFHIEDDSTALD